MTARCVIPYIEKSWISSSVRAQHEAKRQAQEMHPNASVKPTGRTFHEPTDWGFEFVIEGGDS